MRYLELKRESIPAITDELNTLLANYQVYYQKLRNFHWNLKGHNFFDLHVKFEEMYNDAAIKIDAIAERILTLKYRPLSVMSKYLERAEVKETDGFFSDEEMVKEILKAHRIIIANMRNLLHKTSEARDEGTTDLIAGFLKDLEGSSWMLDAWLGNPKLEQVTLSDNHQKA